jgi:hypothetical protein
MRWRNAAVAAAAAEVGAGCPEAAEACRGAEAGWLGQVVEWLDQAAMEAADLLAARGPACPWRAVVARCHKRGPIRAISAAGGPAVETSRAECLAVGQAREIWAVGCKEAGPTSAVQAISIDRPAILPIEPAQDKWGGAGSSPSPVAVNSIAFWECLPVKECRQEPQVQVTGLALDSCLQAAAILM